MSIKMTLQAHHIKTSPNRWLYKPIVSNISKQMALQAHHIKHLQTDGFTRTSNQTSPNRWFYKNIQSNISKNTIISLSLMCNLAALPQMTDGTNMKTVQEYILCSLNHR